MIERRQRQTGEAFLGCRRFPSCRGTLPIAAGTLATAERKKSSDYKLSQGGRYARSLPDLVELLIARRIGRNLTTREGCATQVLAVVGLLAVLYLLVASGALAWILTTFASWFAHQIKLPGAASPTPG